MFHGFGFPVAIVRVAPGLTVNPGPSSTLPCRFQYCLLARVDDAVNPQVCGTGDVCLGLHSMCIEGHDGPQNSITIDCVGIQGAIAAKEQLGLHWYAASRRGQKAREGSAERV